MLAFIGVIKKERNSEKVIFIEKEICTALKKLEE